MSDTLKDTPWKEWKLTSQILGQGTYGVVYKAVNIYTQQYAAIKIIEVSSDKIDKAEKEIAILYQLMERNCPNILCIDDYKIMPYNNKYYIYIRTPLLTSLKERFFNDDYDEFEVIKLGVDISNALDICEEENIIHRDIKPNNILYDATNRNYVLCDFGVAREICEPDDTLTRVGAIGYIAPEVYRGKYDHRADIFSLGLVLYYFANNQKLSKDSDDLSFPPPCNASPKLSDTILKACSFKPSNRFQCAYDLKVCLIGSEHLYTSWKKEPENINEEPEYISEDDTSDNISTIPTSVMKENINARKKYIK